MTVHRVAAIGCLTLLTLCLAGSVSATAVGLAFESRSGAGGSRVEIPLLVTGATGLGAVQFEVVFDQAVLELKDVSAGQAMPGAMLDWNVVSPGRARVAAAASSAATTADGSLMTLVFTVVEGDELTVPLAFENTRAWQYERSLELPVEPQAGSFKRTSGGFPLWLIAVVAVIVVGAGALMLLRRKPAAANDEDRSVPAQGPAAKATPGGFCPHCGKPTGAGGKFCRECGGALS